MDKRILDLVANFAAWRGDTYKLAAQVAELQREIDRESVTNAGFPDAAEAII